MRQVFGYFIILLLLPVIFILQDKIAIEFVEAQHSQGQLTDTIELTSPEFPLPLVMKDRNGDIFTEEYVEWREPLSIDEIPLFVQQLFLKSEDQGFYEHQGYDLTAIVRAFVVNAANEELSQGGSTITQQLARLRYFTTEKTYERKLTEVFYAAELEKQFDKKNIFEMYLNEMYFGNQVYGIGGAATYYFSRPLVELTEAEIAFISAIPNNPSLYNPLKFPERTKKRQERLIDVLQRNEVLSEAEAMAIKEMPIELNIREKVSDFPVYSTYVLSELEELIAHSEGFIQQIETSESIEEKQRITDEMNKKIAEVKAQGIQIETALDPLKQQQDENALNALLNVPDLQAGAAVIENATREIVSFYGGKNYHKADFHRGFQAVRQPGSAMKPVLVYAPLFESRAYTENTLVDSRPICIAQYCPQNFGGYVYGVVPLKEAFRHSHNTAAVRLFQSIGIEEAFAYLQPFDFKSISEEDYQFPAALGGFHKGITPLELANAYTGFIDGTYTPARAIREVKDAEGNLLYKWEREKSVVWSSYTTEKMRSLLKDVVLNGTGRGIPLTTSYTGAKTGTTNDIKDLWTAGLNDRYTTAVWVGYDQPTPMRLKNGKIHLHALSALLRE